MPGLLLLRRIRLLSLILFARLLCFPRRGLLASRLVLLLALLLGGWLGLLRRFRHVLKLGLLLPGWLLAGLCLAGFLLLAGLLRS